MDVQDLNKKQLILLTLLITFVVSIATGIITVSLMKQMPKSVPQTINNVIQRTIEKVTTVEAPTPNNSDKVDTSSVVSKDNSLLFGNEEALISIYLNNPVPATTTTETNTNGENVAKNEPVAIGQGIIISDIGLVLVDSNLIKDQESYKVILNKIDFDVTVLKKFDNGFTVLKISQKKADTKTTEDKSNSTGTSAN